METLHGAGIARKIRALSDSAMRSVSIVSPYIGRWPAVTTIFGGNWWLASPVNLRVITDISLPSNVNAGTLKMLMDRGPVRSLAGVHAKVYIFDEQAVVTSANLTETAFTKRHEIGVYLDHNEASEAIKRFEHWWGLCSPDLTEEGVVAWKPAESPFSDEQEGLSLKTLWPLPSKPDDSLFKEPEQASHKKFKSYQQFISSYKELAAGYSQVQRLWDDAPLFLEVDSFLNFLFHTAPGQPSFAFYEANEPRPLSPVERGFEIETHAAAYKTWALTQQDERWRETFSSLIRGLLAKDRIDTLTIEEAKKVVDCLNCMNARQLNKFKFLQPRNNDIGKIRSAWKELLFGGDSVEKRMQNCDASLHSFGPSSVQELLGWFFPEAFPIRNTNSDAGLRFFGFRV
jgi:hypothetical protein